LDIKQSGVKNKNPKV